MKRFFQYILATFTICTFSSTDPPTNFIDAYISTISCIFFWIIFDKCFQYIVHVLSYMFMISFKSTTLFEIRSVSEMVYLCSYIFVESRSQASSSIIIAVVATVLLIAIIPIVVTFLLCCYCQWRIRYKCWKPKTLNKRGIFF